MLNLSNPAIYSINNESSLLIPEWYLVSQVAIRVAKDNVAWVKAGWVNQYVRSNVNELVIVKSQMLFLNKLQLLTLDLTYQEVKLELSFVDYLDDCSVFVWNVDP